MTHIHKILMFMALCLLTRCASLLSPTTTTTKMPAASGTVSTPTEWNNRMNQAFRNFETDLTLRINNFSESKYSINNLSYTEAQIKSSGQLRSEQGKQYAIINYKIDYKQNALLIRAAQDPTFLNRLSSKDRQVYNEAKQIVSSIVTSKMTPYQREKAIHDYIVKTYEYDRSVVYGSQADNYGPAYMISGLLKNKKGCCEAYSAAFQMFCILAGLDVRTVNGCIGQPKQYVNGKAVNTHAWNIIKLDGEYYHIDVTSDDPVPDVPGRIEYDFFNLSDSELAKTHYYDKSTGDNISCKGTKYQYYRYNNLYVNNMNELGALIKREMAKRNTTINFCTKGFGLRTANEVSKYLDTKIVSSYSVRGQVGKEGAYILTLKYK